jgi:hypothetical protein
MPENLVRRDCLGDLDMDGRIILKLILKQCDERIGTVYNWLMIEPNAELL